MSSQKAREGGGEVGSTAKGLDPFAEIRDILMIVRTNCERREYGVYGLNKDVRALTLAIQALCTLVEGIPGWYHPEWEGVKDPGATP
jgi:hypothetical protein